MVSKLFKYICITNIVIELSPELAEICGIHAGDGYMRNNRHRVELDISGNIEEASYYDEHVAFLFKKVFNIDIKPKHFPSRRTYGFVIRNREIICFLHDLGFPYGKKSAIVRVPKFILQNKNKLMSSMFLRGLLDTDGYLGFRRYYGKAYKPFKVKYPTYPTISIGTVSKGLSEDIRTILQYLGITFNYYFYQSKKFNDLPNHKTTINGKPQINRWMDIIGTKNPSKLSRYLIWKKFGFCPTNLNFQQRQDILKGKTDPFSLGP